MGFTAKSRLGEQKGTVAIMVAILMFVLIGMIALAIDVGTMFVVRNELQNAADAGALAGANQLYYRETDYPPAPEPSLVGWVNPDANQGAEIAAKKNWSLKEEVEVNVGANNDGDVQRGHWSHWERKFYPLDTLEPIQLAGYTIDELDHMDGQGGNPAFINAVRVVARRQEKAVPALFSKIFGYQGFAMSAEAVAYLGFPAQFPENFFDAPLVICWESIKQGEDGFECGQGRLINSSSKGDANTGGWTDFSECFPGTEKPELNMENIINYDRDIGLSSCPEGGVNPEPVSGYITVGGGQVQSAFFETYDCGGFNPSLPNWEDRTVPLNLKVTVAQCNDEGGIVGNAQGCMPIVGVTTMQVVLVTNTFPANPDKKYDRLPDRMGIDVGDQDPFVKSDYSTGLEAWLAFADKFDLQVNKMKVRDLYNSSGDDGFYQKTIYAMPSCEIQPPETAGVGGPNGGIMTTVPVLVKGSLSY